MLTVDAPSRRVMPSGAGRVQSAPDGLGGPMREHEPGELLTAAELARELKVSRRTLARWRSQGTGPPFVRAGRSPRYRWADVQAWLRSTAGEGQPPA